MMLLIAALLSTSSLVAAQDASQTDITSEPITILMMVSDANEREEPDSGASDVMAIVHLDPSTQSCRALNVLPNTRVELEGVGNTRINQALSEGGAELAVSTVEDYLGIEIDHHGVIDLDGIAMAIDAVGGITINNETAFTVGTNEFPAGEITLSGEQAIVYARYTEDPSDMQGRLDRQKTLVEGLTTSMGGGNALESVPSSVPTSLADIEDHIVTDLDLESALEVANAYSTCVPDENTVETMMFTESGAQLDEATQDEQVSGVTDPVTVQAYVEWLMNGGPLPNQ
jgi:LCP family protein required for cell wall assembly